MRFLQRDVLLNGPGEGEEGEGGRGNVDGDDCLEICSPFIVLLLSQCMCVCVCACVALAT